MRGRARALGGSRVLQRLDDELWECYEGAGEDHGRTQEVRQPIVVEVVEREANEGDEDATANQEKALPLGSVSSDRRLGVHRAMMHLYGTPETRIGRSAHHG
jgi:hypothetical protein